MTLQQTPDDAPGTALFPQFSGIHALFATETSGLTDTQLDFDSSRWEWSGWSIRRNLSHVASLHFRWLLTRWAEHDLAAGISIPDDVDAATRSPDDRRLDESKYWRLDDILRKLQEAMDLCQGILARQSVSQLRSREISSDKTSQWGLMSKAHPVGHRQDPTNPEKLFLTLEYTFRHMYFEDITHLYNIQRLKRAQGLSTCVEVPFQGYWALPHWDRSES